MSDDETPVPRAKHAGGRPKGSSSLYSQTVVDEIISRMEMGEPLTAICRVDRDGKPWPKGEFPTWGTVYDWGDPTASNHRPEFITLFARAKLKQHQYWVEEIVEIANTTEIGVEEVQEHSAKFGLSTRKAMRDMIQHRNLKIDTRLKAAARLDPQRWAERLQNAADASADSSQRIIVEGGLPDEDSPRTEDKP